MATLKVGDLGDYIREQRRSAQISLRQLANLAGVSNPYLSQIERGLRKPSAEILQQIAKALRVSAETLYVRAGILEDIPVDRTVVQAVLGDPGLNERQKSVLLQIYESFCTENAEGRRAGRSDAEAQPEPPESPEPVLPEPQRAAPSLAKAAPRRRASVTAAATTTTAPRRRSPKRLEAQPEAHPDAHPEGKTEGEEA